MRKKSRQVEGSGGRLYCDLTQSWSERGGGVRTFLMKKREHILASPLDRHLLIIPGAEDSVVEDGRAITVTIASRTVPGSPNYRLLLNNQKVRSALDRFAPDLIECQDVYNLPWAAIAYVRDHPGCALTASYMTDMPTAYVERPLSKFLGKGVARPLQARRLSLRPPAVRTFRRGRRAQRGRRRGQPCARSGSSGCSSPRSGSISPISRPAGAIRRCAASLVWPTISRC